MGVGKVSRGLMNELYVCECVKVFERASLAKCVIVYVLKQCKGGVSV